METFLVKDKRIKLQFKEVKGNRYDARGNLEQKTKDEYEGKVLMRATQSASATVPTTALNKNFLRVVQPLIDEVKPRTISMALKVIQDLDPENCPQLQVYTKVCSPILKHLLRRYNGKLQVKIELTLRNIRGKGEGRETWNMYSEFWGLMNLQGDFTGFDQRLTSTSDGQPFFMALPNQPIHGKLAIKLTPYRYINLVTQEVHALSLLDMNDTSVDFQLVGRDGSGAGCHLDILVARIPRLQNILLERNWQEGVNRTYRFAETSDDAVVALAKFLYKSDSDAAMENPRIAFELLEISQSYGYQILEEAMQNILLGISWISYDIVTAWRTYNFSRRMILIGQRRRYEQLKTRTISVIQKYVRTIFIKFKNDLDAQEVAGLEEFKEVLQQNPEAMEELQLNFDEEEDWISRMHG